ARGRAVGADEYFVKPFSPVALLNKVYELLGWARGWRGGRPRLDQRRSRWAGATAPAARRVERSEPLGWGGRRGDGPDTRLRAVASDAGGAGGLEFRGRVRGAVDRAAHRRLLTAGERDRRGVAHRRQPPDHGAAAAGEQRRDGASHARGAPRARTGVRAGVRVPAAADLVPARGGADGGGWLGDHPSAAAVQAHAERGGGGAGDRAPLRALGSVPALAELSRRAATRGAATPRRRRACGGPRPGPGRSGSAPPGWQSPPRRCSRARPAGGARGRATCRWRRARSAWRAIGRRRRRTPARLARCPTRCAARARCGSRPSGR